MMFANLLADVDRADTPGIAAAIVQRGELVAQVACGMADLATGRACTPTTNFRLASVTKQLTAAVILLLAETGRVQLDAPIGHVLPEIPPYASSVTIRQLLTHTSGLADYEDLLPVDRRTQVGDAEIPALLPADPLQGLYFAPGTGYRYSNTGYVLLALLAERAADLAFPELLRTRIFAPLGMRTTLAFVAGGPPVPERAYGYSEQNGSWLMTDQSVTSATLGDGGVYSSATDLACWLAAIDEGALLRPETWRAAFTPWAATDDGRQYGFGWFLGQHRGELLVQHDGTTIGFRSAVARLPEQRLAALVLTNRTHAEPMALALKLLDGYIK
jgi:CubicO group peptidase (beta-lactamase class C family)